MTITKLTTGALACILLTVFTMSPAVAMPPPGGPRDEVKIEEAFVGFGPNDTLLINGQDLECRGGTLPDVTLGTLAAPLVIVDASAVHIEAELPAGTPDGDYTLVVSCGDKKHENDEYDLTIGSDHHGAGFRDGEWECGSTVDNDGRIITEAEGQACMAEVQAAAAAQGVPCTQ